MNNSPEGFIYKKNLLMWVLLEVKGLLGGSLKVFFLKNTSIKGKGLYEGGDYSRKYDT